jgi:hypothetical protein
MYSGRWLPTFWRNLLPLLSAFTSVLKMVAVFSSETLITTYQTAGCHNSNSQNVYLYQCRNPIPHTFSYIIICVKVYHAVSCLEVFQPVLSMNL